MAETNIQWADFTFNPWSGCTKVSPGCKNCYAEVNYSVKMRGVKWGPQGNRIVAADSMWKQPIAWNKKAATWKSACNGDLGIRPRVFCASLADVFEDWQGPMLNSKGEQLFNDDDGHFPTAMQDVRARLFRLIDATPNLDWLVLTKRPENIRKMIPPVGIGDFRDNDEVQTIALVPRNNLWLGTSPCDQKTAYESIPHLLACADLCRVLFLSCEPLLSEVILHKYFAQCQCGHGHGFTACPNTGGVAKTCHLCECRNLRPKLSWVIVGGESGHGARPNDIAWTRSIIDQCKAAGVACFVKQLGANCEAYNAIDPLDQFPNGTNFAQATGDGARILFRDKKGGSIEEWPADLQVRQFPRAS